MKNEEKESIKHLIMLIIWIIIFGLILYPIFDLIYCKFITNSRFVYSVNDHIIKPIIIGVIAGIVFFIVDKKKNK